MTRQWHCHVIEQVFGIKIDTIAPEDLDVVVKDINQIAEEMPQYCWTDACRELYRMIHGDLQQYVAVLHDVQDELPAHWFI